MSKRFSYLVAAVLIIACGLLSRRISAIPAATGDALWSMMVFCVWRIIMPRRRLYVIGLLALLTSFAVEFSQMVSTPWLDSFRSTFIGHMMLGQGFLWTDLIAYTAGTVVIFLVALIFDV